ncbi:hypothetical protein H4Q26_012458 [Puccinia striiformis f. sp. tritici PST-130]|nr:hypothetical protein Pst134EB_003868 [Puccinia striiformis f. sp. tritici]KAI9618114.1 hypothetical protein H4Q26_012458 [Puccinia striiformis f. sp. tritici PST-130]
MHSETRPFTLSPSKLKVGGLVEGHESPRATPKRAPTNTNTMSSFENYTTTGNTYQQAIIEIYESLYQFQRERNDSQEAQVVDCISKWYELNAVFENPFTRAVGIQAIVNQFSLMSFLPGQIWSELGDICESEDYNGNRVVIFSHTLHFDLLGSTDLNSSTTGMQTPYLSVPVTPHGGGTPGTMMNTRYPSFQSAIYARMGSTSSGPQSTTLSQRLKATRSGRESETTWPLYWLISHLSPSQIKNNLFKFDLKLATRLQFNEQARIVTHDDIWGLKELLEFLSPNIFTKFYSFQRWLVGQSADFLSSRYLRSSSSSTDNTTVLSSENGVDDHHHHSLHSECLIAHSPILIRPTTTNTSPLNAHKPHDSSFPTTTTTTGNTATVGNEDEEDDDDDEQNTEAGSIDLTHLTP